MKQSQTQLARVSDEEINQYDWSEVLSNLWLVWLPLVFLLG
jgi:hypothetical protein